MRTLVIKTGALGDVLRSTSILPGLAERHPDLDVTWVTAPTGTCYSAFQARSSWRAALTSSSRRTGVV